MNGIQKFSMPWVLGETECLGNWFRFSMKFLRLVHSGVLWKCQIKMPRDCPFCGGLFHGEVRPFFHRVLIACCSLSNRVSHLFVESFSYRAHFVVSVTHGCHCTLCSCGGISSIPLASTAPPPPAPLRVFTIVIWNHH